MAKIITLLTDFGTRDGYAASMKGVMLAAAPAAVVVDATHEIASQDVASAAYVLAQYWNFYPEGTVHVAVVDPGVGMDRQALLVEADERILLAPDNGLLALVAATARRVKARVIRPGVGRSGWISSTFHGRDVFAWVAGKLAAGEIQPGDVSDPARVMAGLPWPSVETGPEELRGTIIYIDQFGNLITNITRPHLVSTGWSAFSVTAGETEVGSLLRTYGEAVIGDPVALLGSLDHLEVAVRNGSAAASLGLTRGDPVIIRRSQNRTAGAVPA